MVHAQHIRTGLTYSFRTLKSPRESQCSLSRLPDKLVLLCQFSPHDCNISINDQVASYELQFEFSNEFLIVYGNKESFNLDHFIPFNQKEICCNTQMVLHDIVKCKHSGILKSMFLESKALSLLLYFQNEQTSIQALCNSCKFLSKPIEKDKIFKAKELILNSLDKPYTIPELSMIIGINQCYLKKGFKEIFGKTVYDFVQEQRMLKAKLLLTTTNVTVSQIADQIGFSSQSNFSAAFKKYAGVFPSELQRVQAEINS